MTNRLSAAEYRDLVDESMTEDELVRWIVDLAQSLGWWCTHFLPALNSKGRWRTALQGNPGFVDLVLAKPGRPTHLWEAKSERGQIRPAQRAWLHALGAPSGLKPSAAGIWWPVGQGITVGVIRPSMRQEVEKELS